MKTIELLSVSAFSQLAAKVDDTLPITNEKDLLDLLRSQAQPNIELKQKLKSVGATVELVYEFRWKYSGQVVLLRSPPGVSLEQDIEEIQRYLRREDIESIVLTSG